MGSKNLDEWAFAARVRDELQTKDEARFKVIMCMGRIFPIKGLFEDEDGNHYEINQEADIEQMNESLLKDMKVKIELRFDTQEVVIKKT